MKVVSPYRPFVPESPAHRKLGPFDWPAALAMLAVSVRQSCRCECYALTDPDTPLQVPAHRYATTEPRLMLWLLEVCLTYLSSDAFDDDTVMVSPDALVLQDLRPWFLADLGVLVRIDAKFAETKPLLNGVQFWRQSARHALVAFFAKALALARTLPASVVTWGADTVPLVELLSPLQHRLMERSGLQVWGIPASQLARAIAKDEIIALQQGRTPRPAGVPIIDFKYLRKQFMRPYFDARFGNEATA